jgi:hypothetical protein
MIPADLALAQLINKTAQAYVSNAPAYITYTERTRVSAPSLGRSQEINRYVAVRQADDYAVMQDLPAGAQRTGQAFPIIPYFDPVGQSFDFSWYANLKKIDITLHRANVGYWPVPDPDPNVSVVIPYASFWTPAYMPDSTPSHLHIRVTPTPAYGQGFYLYDIMQDPQTQLPSHIEMRTTDDTEVITLDYQVLQGHWVITRGTFTSMEHFGPMTFQVVAQTDYMNIAFPATPPDPRLAGTPAPAGTATPSTR